MTTITQEQTDRFWEKVDVQSIIDCWEWKASLKPEGYGQLRINHKTLYAHRVSWLLKYGNIPKGIQVNHHCDNRRCVNPHHLYLGTQKDNIRDMYNRNRQKLWYPKGIKHPMVKLTESQVLEIRELFRSGKYTRRELAKKFNISESTSGRIVTRKLWKHL